MSDEIWDWAFGDEALLQASIDFEPEVTAPPQPSPLPPAVSSLPLTSSTRRPFASPKTDAQVSAERISGVPQKTQEDTKYYFRLWIEWRANRETKTGEEIKNLTEMSNFELQYWLTKFILEIRKQDGSAFTPNSLHHIVAGVMRYLRWNGKPDTDFFRNSDFSDFRASLDAEMKETAS